MIVACECEILARRGTYDIFEGILGHPKQTRGV